MEKSKNIIVGIDNNPKAFTYEVWTLVEKEDKFKLIKRLIQSDEKDLKLGQEVDLLQTLIKGNQFDKIIIANHDSSHISGRDGQIQRLNNIKLFAIAYLKSENEKNDFINFYNNFMKSKECDFDAGVESVLKNLKEATKNIKNPTQQDDKCL